MNIRDMVKILELKCTGHILGIYRDSAGTQYNVRYFYNGEAKTVYFFEDEIVPAEQATYPEITLPQVAPRPSNIQLDKGDR